MSSHLGWWPSRHFFLALCCTVLQISEKQLYETEKKFKMYEAMINVMDEEVRENAWMCRA